LCEGQGGPELEPVMAINIPMLDGTNLLRKGRDLIDCPRGPVRQARHFAKDDVQIESTDYEID